MEVGSPVPELPPYLAKSSRGSASNRTTKHLVSSTFLPYLPYLRYTLSDSQLATSLSRKTTDLHNAYRSHRLVRIQANDHSRSGRRCQSLTCTLYLISLSSPPRLTSSTTSGLHSNASIARKVLAPKNQPEICRFEHGRTRQ